MADIQSETTLSVNVTGEEGIQRLAAALQSLQQSSASIQGAVSAGSVSATVRQGEQQLGQITSNAVLQAGTIGQRMAQSFGAAVQRTIKAPFDVLRTSGQAVGQSLLGFSGSLGSIASSAGLTSVAIVGVGAALTGVLVPILSLIAGFKLLRSSFDWANQAAQEQLTVAGRTRRFYPALLGESLNAAEDEMRSRMGVATALFGDAADQMQENITRRLTAFRLGRGLRGDRDIFARWGITAEAVSGYEQRVGRIDLTRWLELFTIKRQQLETQLSQAQSPLEQQLIRRRLMLLSDDTVKIFGQKFSDMVNTFSEDDLVRLRSNIDRATPLGRVEDATRKTIDYTIALESLKATIGAIMKGIGADVQPTLTRFMVDLNTRLLDTKEGGEGLGRSLRDLAAAMANNAWQVLRDILAELTPEKINEWIAYINDNWKPEETADTIKTIFRALVDIGKAVGQVVSAIKQFIDALPPFLKMTPQDALNRLMPGNALQNAPADFSTRFGGGSGDFAPGGGGGAPAGGGPAGGPAPAPSGGPAAPGPGRTAPIQAAPAAPGPSAPFSAPYGFGGGLSPTTPATPPGQAPAVPPATSAAPGPPSPSPPPTATFEDRFGAVPAAPAQTEAMRGAQEALKGAAMGRALSVMTNVEQTPSGPVLSMKSDIVVPEGVGQAAPGPRGGPAPNFPSWGMGTQPANPFPFGTAIPRTPDDTPTNIAPYMSPLPTAPDLTAPATFGQRFQFTGGMSTEDAAAWGTAAAQQIVDGLDGVNIPMFGRSQTSSAVTPWTAPKPTGGDTPSES